MPRRFLLRCRVKTVASLPANHRRLERRAEPSIASVACLALACIAATGTQVLAQSEQRAPPAPRVGLASGDHTFTLRHGDRNRRYLVHVPTGLSEQLPVMIAFHGGGGNAEGFKSYSGLDALADRERFIVVYPNGTGVLPNRLLTFNGGGCCGYAANRQIDDVGFTIAVLEDLARRTSIDRKRVYATGHSNGAIMAYRLAAERAETIAAIVPVAGAMSVDSFAPSRPVAVMHIHSVDDPRALYGGGLGPPFPGTNNRETHAAVEEALERWIRANGCPASARTEERRTSPAGNDAVHTATRLVWSPCNGGSEVAQWKLTGAGHGWPGSQGSGLSESIVGPGTNVVDAAAEAWAFASRFRLQ
jgi:polyhydroxybutyrate depolymerase